MKRNQHLCAAAKLTTIGLLATSCAAIGRGYNALERGLEEIKNPSVAEAHDEWEQVPAELSIQITPQFLDQIGRPEYEEELIAIIEDAADAVAHAGGRFRITEEDDDADADAVIRVRLYDLEIIGRTSTVVSDSEVSEYEKEQLACTLRVRVIDGEGTRVANSIGKGRADLTTGISQGNDGLKIAHHGGGESRVRTDDLVAVVERAMKDALNECVARIDDYGPWRHRAEPTQVAKNE